MDLVADILLIAGAIGAAFYCIVLSRRLSRFTDLEKGVGGAIAVLSAQVDDMTKTLGQAQGSANGANASLEALTTRAEDVARRLEMMVAAMHDIPADNDPETQPELEPEPDSDEAVEFTHKARQEEADALFRSHHRYVQEAAV